MKAENRKQRSSKKRKMLVLSAVEGTNENSDQKAVKQ